MLYQCIGLSGAILFFYGLLASALTNIYDDTFVRGLWIVGLIGMAIFVIKSLDRVWQKIVVFGVGFNALWILFSVGQGWPWYGYLIPSALIVLLVLFLRKWKMDWISLAFLGIAGALMALYFVWDQDKYIQTTALISALVLNVLAFMACKDAILKAAQSTKKFNRNTLSYAYAGVVFFILIIFNILSQDFHKQWDLTQNNLNTLSEQSVKVLEGIDTPLDIRIFQKKGHEQQAYAKMLMGFYENASKKIKVSYIDPDVDKFLSEKYNAKDGDVVVSKGEQSYTTKSLSEEGITQAMMNVTQARGAHLCFTTGHGELDIEGEADNPRAMGFLKKGLENEGYSFEVVGQISDQMPETCDVLIVAGAQQALTPNEVNVIGQFIDSKGKAIFLLDPIFPDPRLGDVDMRIKNVGLKDLLARYGFEVGSNLLLQKSIALFEGEQIVSQITGFEYGDHPIVEPLKGKQTVFDGVQSVQGKQDYEGTTYELVKSFGSGASWTKANMQELMVDQNASPGPSDMQGPVPFVVASEKQLSEELNQKTQIIVAGDADFISNDMIVSNEYNFDLFLNMLGWLSGAQEKISIRPKMFRSSAIELSATQSKTIFYVAVIFLPMLVLLFGVNLWWIRRNRG